MKKLSQATLFIILTGIFFTKAYSQVWCPAGATWYYTNETSDAEGYSKLTYTTDTTIHSISCKKIINYFKLNTALNGTVQGYGTPYYTYSQGSVAYIYNNLYGNDKFDTLFDINAQTGKRWRMPLVDTACADSLFFVRVLKTGTTMLNGFNLKWLYVSFGPYDEHGSSILDTITERLGFRFDNLDYSSCRNIASERYQGDLRCYSDDTFGNYSTGESITCDFMTGISESLAEKWGLKIYPNPANEKLTITTSLKQKQKAVFELMDLTGKSLYSTELTEHTNSIELSTLSLNQGMYMYRLSTGNVIVQAGKLSIIH